MTSNGESLVSETKLTQENMESMRSSSGVGGDARARRLGKLEPMHSAIFVCDLQEKFAPSITHFNTVVNNTERLLKVANILGIPIIATEQYPKVLQNLFILLLGFQIRYSLQKKLKMKYNNTGF